MNRTVLSAFVVTIGMFGITPGAALAQQARSSAPWSDDAARAAGTVVRQGLAAVERLDAEAFRSLSAGDLVAYDIDLEGRPVRMGSLEAAVAYVAAIGTEVKKTGATVRFENLRNDCRATTDVAYCLLEYAFVSTAGDGTRMSQPSQTTVVLTNTGGGWKWAHWHTSLSAAPASGPSSTPVK